MGSEKIPVIMMNEKDKPSYHESINEMYEKFEEDNVTNSWDRYNDQKQVRCKFCEEGVSCTLCSNGPCRIIPGTAEKGTCGIDAAGIAMRNMVHRNSMGISAYTYHANEVAKTLKATAEGKTPFEIKDKEKLMYMANKFGINTDQSIEEVTKEVADYMIDEINRDVSEKSKMIEIFAPEQRKEVWEELGIMPGGPTHEVNSALTSSMTNVDGDYQSLALKALKLGLASTYGSLLPLELGQDVLFGTAEPHKMDVGLGVLDENYINIVPNGHEPFVGVALMKAAKKEKNQKKAKEAGAEGIHVVASIETGQEIIQRYEMDEVLAGFTGNWLNVEYMMATGAVDLMAADMNCSPPQLGELAEEYGGKIVPVSEVVGVPKAEDHINYKPEKVEEQADKLIEKAIQNYKERKGKETKIPDDVKTITAGMSPRSITNALGGELDPLLEAISDGTIKGVVALVSCTTYGNGPQDATSIAVAEKLIENDILVLSAGCGNAAMQQAGLTSTEAIEKAGEGLTAVCEQVGIPPVLSYGTCTDTGRLSLLVTQIAEALDVDTSELPIAVTAPEYMEQKAIIDGFFSVAYGLYTHVSPMLPITGSDNLVNLLTEDVENLTGGKVAVGDEPEEIVQGVVNHIEQKRQNLGI